MATVVFCLVSPLILFLCIHFGITLDLGVTNAMVG